MRCLQLLVRLCIDVDPYMEVHVPTRSRLLQSVNSGLAGKSDMPTFKTGAELSSINLICSAIILILDKGVTGAALHDGLAAGHAELLLQALRAFAALITFGHLAIQDAICGEVREKTPVPASVSNFK